LISFRCAVATRIRGPISLPILIYPNGMSTCHSFNRSQGMPHLGQLLPGIGTQAKLFVIEFIRHPLMMETWGRIGLLRIHLEYGYVQEVVQRCRNDTWPAGSAGNHSDGTVFGNDCGRHTAKHPFLWFNSV